MAAKIVASLMFLFGITGMGISLFFSNKSFDKLGNIGGGGDGFIEIITELFINVSPTVIKRIFLLLISLFMAFIGVMIFLYG